MSANANDTVDSLHRAGREAAGDLRRRAGHVRDYAGDELRAFLADVEDLVKRVGNVADADVARARAKVVSAMGEVRRMTSDTADSLRERAQAAAEQADEYVRERPWTAIGLAASIGLIVGVGVTALGSRR